MLGDYLGDGIEKYFPNFLIKVLLTQSETNDVKKGGGEKSVLCCFKYTLLLKRRQPKIKSFG